MFPIYKRYTQILLTMTLLIMCQSIDSSTLHGKYTELTTITTSTSPTLKKRARLIPTQQQIFATDIRDKIIELQCYAKCNPPSSNIKSMRSTNNDPVNCSDHCKIEQMNLPRRGYCPNTKNAIFTNLAPLHKLYCFDNCNFDYDCPVIQKCCDSSCGPICMEPIGVRDDNFLPPIPKIYQYKVTRGHKVEITIDSSVNATFIYHIEVRSHIGIRAALRKFGMWQWQPVEKIAESGTFPRTRRTVMSFSLKPGRWYQVRVAAINEYGFRGYSESSKPFALPNHPRPPKSPKDLKVISATIDNGYYTVTIIWCPSKSSLPIEKYKIIWSLYVKSNDASLISYEAYVKDAHNYDIQKLLPNSSYYIQIQAISISGSRRLKSEKCSILYNTTTTALIPFIPLKCAQQFNRFEYNRSKNTNNNNNNIDNNQKTFQTNKINDISKKNASYDVNFRMNRKFGMIVQISGFQPNKEKVYVYELYPKDTNSKQSEYSAIRAKKGSLEFSKLNFNTTYILKPFKMMSEESDPLQTFVFTTPKCENFRKRFPKIHLKCSL